MDVNRSTGELSDAREIPGHDAVIDATMPGHYVATLDGRHVATCNTLDDARAAIIRAMHDRYGLIPAPA